MAKIHPSAAWRAFFVQNIKFWQLNAFFWGVFGVGSFALRLAMGESAPRALGFVAHMWVTCWALSLLLRTFFRRTRGEFGLYSAFLVIVLGLFAAFIQVFVSVVFTAWTGWHNPLYDFFVNVTLRMIVMWATFMMWGLSYFWLWAETDRSHEKEWREETQREAQRMELQMLRAQLDPHFLFNSLNGIAAEIRPHPEAAVEMVGELSDYLRYSLDHRKEPTSRLSAELGAMDSYLRIERARFGDRLSFSVDADDAARRRLVPSFLLQPLVENAVKHGLDRAAGRLDIAVVARARGEQTEISVSNSGTLATDGGSRGGLGLETLRRRLELHYPLRHRFAIEERDGRVVSTLQLWGDPCCA